MTVEDLQNYYADLLILQYRGKLRAYAMIKTLVGIMIMDMLPNQVQDAYNIETAVGKQLDVLGKYIGISRMGYDFSGFVTLNDDNYRKVLQLKTAQNNSGSALSDIQTFLHNFFPDQIFVFDFEGMRLQYYVNSALSTEVVQFFIKNHLLPKPMGVQLSATIYGPTIHDFFGFATYANTMPLNKPFNTYATYHTDYTWFSDANVLVP